MPRLQHSGAHKNISVFREKTEKMLFQISLKHDLITVSPKSQ